MYRIAKAVSGVKGAVEINDMTPRRTLAKLVVNSFLLALFRGFATMACSIFFDLLEWLILYIMYL